MTGRRRRWRPRVFTVLAIAAVLAVFISFLMGARIYGWELGAWAGSYITLVIRLDRIDWDGGR